MKRLKIMFSFCLVLFLSTAAGATSFSLQGSKYDFLTADILFVYNSVSYEIGIEVKNTSTDDSVITGFAFNSPDNVTGIKSFTGPSSDWDYLFSPNNISSPEPFGFFDIAALTGNNLGGGNPQSGIGVGKTGTFNFGLKGTNLASLDVDSFLNIGSYVPDQGKGSNADSVYFLARYQQVGDGGFSSDVAIPTNGTEPVPEPGTMILLGIGLMGMGVVRRKFKK